MKSLIKPAAIVAAGYFIMKAYMNYKVSQTKRPVINVDNASSTAIHVYTDGKVIVKPSNDNTITVTHDYGASDRNDRNGFEFTESFDAASQILTINGSMKNPHQSWLRTFFTKFFRLTPQRTLTTIITAPSTCPLKIINRLSAHYTYQDKAPAISIDGMTGDKDIKTIGTEVPADIKITHAGTNDELTKTKLKQSDQTFIHTLEHPAPSAPKKYGNTFIKSYGGQIIVHDFKGIVHISAEELYPTGASKRGVQYALLPHMQFNFAERKQDLMTELTDRDPEHAPATAENYPWLKQLVKEPRIDPELLSKLGPVEAELLSKLNMATQITPENLKSIDLYALATINDRIISEINKARNQPLSTHISPEDLKTIDLCALARTNPGIIKEINRALSAQKKPEWLKQLDLCTLAREKPSVIAKINPAWLAHINPRWLLEIDRSWLAKLDLSWLEFIDPDWLKHINFAAWLDSLDTPLEDSSDAPVAAPLRPKIEPYLFNLVKENERNNLSLKTARERLPQKPQIYSHNGMLLDARELYKRSIELIKSRQPKECDLRFTGNLQFKELAFKTREHQEAWYCGYYWQDAEHKEKTGHRNQRNLTAKDILWT